jgi:hypothetical protein
VAVLLFMVCVEPSLHSVHYQRSLFHRAVGDFAPFRIGSSIQPVGFRGLKRLCWYSSLAVANLRRPELACLGRIQHLGQAGEFCPATLAACAR